jgi:hypothetical protein
MATSYTNLVQRSLDLAAGTPVSALAYEEAGINLAKLQVLGKAYRQGWLHNVLRRITPLTTRETDDYVLMADLFIADAAQAHDLLTKMSSDLSMFATAAGVQIYGAIPLPLRPHTTLYQTIAGHLERKFAIQAPRAFAAGVFDAQAQNEMPFIRSFVKAHFRAA